MKYTKKVWVIVDKNRKVIASGVPRNRQLKFLDSTEGTQRILTYGSKKKAEAGFKVSGFYSWGDVGEYIDKEYGYDYGHTVGFKDFLEAVEAEFSIEV